MEKREVMEEIVFNGKRYKIIPIEDESSSKKKSCFDRVCGEDGNYYYCIGPDGNLRCKADNDTYFDSDLFDAANYCTDEEVMEIRARHETLARKLWRYSMEHDDQESSGRFCIRMGNTKPYATETYFEEPTSIIFSSMEAAQGAIKEILMPFLDGTEL